MNKKKVDLPSDYSVEEIRVKGRNYTILRIKERIILALRTKHCPPSRIEGVIQSTLR